MSWVVARPTPTPDVGRVFQRLALPVLHASPVERVATGSRVGRSVARRFVAGETLEEALAAARRLQQAGMSVSLNHLGEEVTDPKAAAQALEDYRVCLTAIASEGIDANLSVKLTQLGMGFDPEAAEAALAELAAAAGAANTTITIDMEDSRWTEQTVAMYEKVQRSAGNLGLALQAYLYRTVDDLRRLLPSGGHIRLCKGAYAEPPTLAWQSAGEVDDSFASLLPPLMACEEVYPAIATHDERLISLTRNLAVSRTAAFEYQMMYGVREPLQGRLVADGFRVRVYVPYGSHWYPYLTRRLAERPANLMFFVRALIGR